MNNNAINPMNVRGAQTVWVYVLALVALDLVLWLTGLWRSFWGMGVLINFVLIVVIASEIGNRVPFERKALYDRLLAFSFPVMILLVWEASVALEMLNGTWFPPPSRIVVGIWELTVEYDRFNKSSLLGRPWLIPQEYADSGMEGVQALFEESHVYATLSRVMLGFLFGSIPGIVIGIAMGMNRTVRLMLDTTLSAVYVLPKIAIFPIMMLVFPNPFGEGPKIAVVAISAFFLVVINTMTGVRDIDTVYLQAGRNYGANRWQMFWHVIFPGALPVIFSGLRLALGTGLIVIVAIEFLRARVGVGRVILYHWEILSTEKMYAGLLVTMLLGILLTYGLQWLERRIMPWRDK